ncbi:MAG: hypothetical protein JXA06_01340 [Bacteroidetes bacterium]|nr:hypothetical protein [Bacteroidota bacterium]
MKKIFMVAIMVALVASFASAQNIWGQGKMSAGGGVELALPTGTAGDVYGMGFGFFGLFQYGLSPDFLLTGQLGYNMFGEKDFGGVKSSLSSFNILAGGKYNLSKAVTPGFYALLQLGLYNASATVTSPAVTYMGYTYGGGEVSASSSEFVFIPGVGMQFGSFDASVKYVINGDIGNLALDIAYVVPL